MQNALTVTEFTARVKSALEPAFSRVWVQGEVSNFRPAASGHLYFSLKDAGAMVGVAVFSKGSRRFNFDLRDGMQILICAKISVYAPRGGYQLIADQIEPLGAGALQLAFEQLKEKLSQEGLFDPRRKRALPRFPTRIAIVTSPTGAAIRDMLNILARRAPQVRVTVIPAVVQGDEAPKHLMRGLEAANRFDLGDVVVLARGGGSIEDMWCFNDEALARAIFQSRLPVVSAVGHEIDFTISDFVADLRAPTPSAAAEIVSQNWVEVARVVKDAQDRLARLIVRDLTNRRRLLDQVSARVISPRDRLREQAQRCDELALRLERAIRVRLDKRRSQLETWAGRLNALSPLQVLERGYSIVKAPDQHVIKSVRQVKKGMSLELQFSDGSAKVQAI